MATLFLIISGESVGGGTRKGKGTRKKKVVTLDCVHVQVCVCMCNNYGYREGGIVDIFNSILLI